MAITQFNEPVPIVTVLQHLADKGIAFIAGHSASTIDEVKRVFSKLNWAFDEAEVAAHVAGSVTSTVDAALQAAQDRIAELELMLGDKPEVLEQLKAGAAELQGTIDAANAKVQDLEKQLEDLRAELTGATATTETLKAQIGEGVELPEGKTWAGWVQELQASATAVNPAAEPAPVAEPAPDAPAKGK